MDEQGDPRHDRVVYVLHREGIPTGIDLEALIAVAAWLAEKLERRPDGQLYRAGNFPP